MAWSRKSYQGQVWLSQNGFHTNPRIMRWTELRDPHISRCGRTPVCAHPTWIPHFVSHRISL